MNIYLKKFGTILTSRQLGKEASAAFEPSLAELKEGDDIVIDFEGVEIFSPSWGDEFLTPLADKYKNKLILKNTENASVKATLKMLEGMRGYKFNIKM